MCDDNKKIEELVTELDIFFKNGGSHMNVEFNDKATNTTIIKSCNECCDGKNACGIPTELDEEDE